MLSEWEKRATLNPKRLSGREETMREDFGERRLGESREKATGRRKWEKIRRKHPESILGKREGE